MPTMYIHVYLYECNISFTIQDLKSAQIEAQIQSINLTYTMCSHNQYVKYNVVVLYSKMMQFCKTGGLA